MPLEKGMGHDSLWQCTAVCQKPYALANPNEPGHILKAMQHCAEQAQWPVISNLLMEPLQSIMSVHL